MTRLCKIGGCGRVVDAKELCSTHYKRLKLYGDPLFGPKFKARKGEISSFLDMAKSYNDDKCLFWPFARNSAGYGHFSAGGGKNVLAHRYICEHENGFPSEKFEALHSCNNGHLGCVNRKHLRWATHRENMQDMLNSGHAMTGEKQHMCKLTEDNVRIIRSSTIPQKELADIFGVTRSNISVIRRRKSWRHI